MWFDAEWQHNGDAVEVRYQGGRRQAPQLRPLPTGGSLPNPWKLRGVYLITGGAGGLGMQLAEYLAHTVQACILLAGRSALTPEKQQRLHRITEIGGTVHYVRADVTAADDVRRLFREVRASYGHLDGIIHAAGETHDSYLLHKDLTRIADVLGTKVAGTVLLDELSRDWPLDCFVLCSSTAAFFGNAGQVDYAAANGYLDAFAAWRELRRKRSRRSGRTLALNWPPLQDAGLRVSEVVQERLRNEIGLEPLPSVSAWQALPQALAVAGPQCILLHGQRDRLDRFVLNQATLPPAPSEGPSSSSDKVDQARRLLRSIFAAELKIPADRIRLREPLERYGLDSVMIHQLNSALEQRLGPLPRTLLFEHASIEELAEYLAQNHAARLQVATDGSGTSFPAPAVSRPSVSPADRSQSIAIIGVSGRYPESATWISSGRTCVPAWTVSPRFPGNAGPWRASSSPVNPNRGGAIPGGAVSWRAWTSSIPCCSRSRADAALIDPQERLFLEATWTALENAGYTRHTLAQGRGSVGVFVGVMYGEYELLANEETARGRYVPAHSPYWSIANRVSFVFNLHGPSLAIDTACSSSLTAVHLACESLSRGECQVALAGGVNLNLHPSKYLGLSHGRFASTDGRCRSFGEGGDGYVPGEGVGALVLKPLAQAEADGDFIHGVIRATTINHGGKTNRYTAPNPLAQADLIAAALQRAGVSPRSISYLEAHGTGTELGDPLEMRALDRAFQGGGETQSFCALGSVKSSIGHLEAASGMAAITKVLLQLRHGQLAPTLHCERINPSIDFAHSAFFLQRELTEWKRPLVTENDQTVASPRRAGISSFGAGGANAHLILEEYRTPAREAGPAKRPLVFVLSARTEECLRRYTADLRRFLAVPLEPQVPLADVLFTLQVGRESLRWRLAVVAQDRGDLLALLDRFLDRRESAGIITGEVPDEDEGVDALANRSQDLCSLADRGQSAQLARHWVGGAEVDWLALGFGNGRRRVPVPTYPFERKRYWITQRSLRLPPWPGRLSPGPDGVSLCLYWKRSDSILADHRVQGQLVFPAAGYLELVRSALEPSIADGARFAGFQGVVWPSPLLGNEEKGALCSLVRGSAEKQL